MRRALNELSVVAIFSIVPALFLGLGFWLLPAHGAPRWLPFVGGAVGGAAMYFSRYLMDRRHRW